MTSQKAKEAQYILIIQQKIRGDWITVWKYLLGGKIPNSREIFNLAEEA